jgi:hypothetical protein
MKTVIAEDRINRFAELDHTVVDELRVMVEISTSELADNQSAEARGRLARLYTTLLASIRLSPSS